MTDPYLSGPDKRQYLVGLIREQHRSAPGSYRTFLETGTADGGTVAAVYDEFDKLYSVELGDDHYFACERRFFDLFKAKIIHGDSQIIMQALMQDLNENIFFWLDAHYDGGDAWRGAKDTPVADELEHIFYWSIQKNLNHLILVDDARFFGTNPAYPTLDHIHELSGRFGERRYYYPEVINDIIHILPFA